MSKAWPIEGFDPHDSLGSGLRKILLTRCEEMFSYAEKARIFGEAETIHDMRVAARRLQIVLKTFKKKFPKKEIKEYTRTLRLLIRSLGEVREKDVLIEKMEKCRATCLPGDVRALDVYLSKHVLDRELAREKLLQLFLAIKQSKFKRCLGKFVKTSL